MTEQESTPTIVLVPFGSPIRCNRCQAQFKAPWDMHRSPFFGQAAARLQDEFCYCPDCETSDVHWVYASDVMPQFQGTPGQIRRQQREWLQSH